MPVDHRRKRGGKNTPHRVFGEVLRELRLKGGFSQDSFAFRSGYHRNYIGGLERGEKSPSLKALFDFAESLGLKPSKLVEKVERRASLR